MVLAFLIIAEVFAHDEAYDVGEGAMAMHGHAIEGAIGTGVGYNFSQSSTNFGVFGENYFGFGYLGKSEAEAGQVMRFDCDSQDLMNYLIAYCGDEYNPDGPISQLITPTMERMVLDKMRQKFVEYASLQFRALASLGRKKKKLQLPKCVDKKSNLWLASPEDLPTGTDLAAKEEATKSNMELQSLSIGILFEEKLERASQKLNCETYYGSRPTECNPLQFTQYRVQSSMPLLFRAAILGTDQKPQGLGLKRPGYEEYKKALYQLIGAHNNIGTSTPADDEKRGQELIDKSLPDAPFSEIDRRVERALTDGANAPAGSPLGKAMKLLKGVQKKLADNWEASLTETWQDLCKPPPKSQLIQDMSRDSIKISQMALKYPNVVRQLMLDLKVEERALAKAVYCNLGVQEQMERAPQCQGVTGGPLPQNPVTIGRRKINDWPYGSQNYFSIADGPIQGSEPDRPYKVKLKINVNIGSSLNMGEDKNIDGIPDQVECQLQKWQKDINSWTNCSTGVVPQAEIQTSNNSVCVIDPADAGTGSYLSVDTFETKECPFYPDMAAVKPKVKFEIEFNPSKTIPTPPPTINVHRCYRMEIVGNVDQKGNCDEVRKFHERRCIESAFDKHRNCVSSGLSEDICREKIEKDCHLEVEQKESVSGQGWNRPDSANYILNQSTSTMRHEVLHLFGLADEYPSKDRPFSYIGEYNSIMRSSSSLFSRLYPRHMSQVLEPLQCLDGNQAEVGSQDGPISESP